MVAVRGYRWVHRWRTGTVLLAVTAALVSALAFVEPAQADDAPVDPAATSETQASPATDQPPADTGSGETPPSDPAPAPEPEATSEPPPAESAPEQPSSSGETSTETTEPTPAEEPAGEPVTLEPEPESGPEACTAASEAEDAQSGTCEASSEGAAAESPPAAPEQGQVTLPAATAPSVAATPTAPPAAQPPAAPAAPVVLVVALAPEQPAAAPVHAETVAGLGPAPTDAPVAAQWDAVSNGAAVSDGGAVELARVPVPVARLVGSESFLVSPAVAWPAPLLAPPLNAAALRYLPALPGAIGSATSPGARAGPNEQDGHRKVATEAEPAPPSAQVGPPGLLDDQGPGASGGSAGGGPGNAASSCYFAIATAPLRFGFPSAFAYAPPPSSVPTGALEAAPTTRPG